MLFKRRAKIDERRRFVVAAESKCAALESFAAGVGCHDDNRVAEVDAFARGIRERSFVEDLQEQRLHVAVRFFEFVKKHDRMRPCANAVGELGAFAVADVARRRADELAHGKTFRKFAHVQTDE